MFAGIAGGIVGIVVGVLLLWTVVLPSLNWVFDSENFKSELPGFRSYKTFRAFWVGWVTGRVFRNN